MTRPIYKRVQLMRVHFSTALTGTLQSYLEAATAAPLDLDETEYPSAQFGAVRLNEPLVASKNGGIRLKIVGHALGEYATTVPRKVALASSPESAAAAPVDQSFKNGDFFLVVRGDYIVGMGDHMRVETAVRYIRELLAKRLNNPAFASLTTSSVFKYDAAQQLQNEGLGSIEFDATMAAAALDKVKDDQEKSAVRAFVDRFVEQVKAVGTLDPDPQALAGVRVNISVSVVGGVRGNDMAKKLLDAAAEDLLAVDADKTPEVSATIVTKQGNPISIGEATVGSIYRVKRRERESSLRDSEVWDALEDFDTKVVSLGDLKT